MSGISYFVFILYVAFLGFMAYIFSGSWYEVIIVLLFFAFFIIIAIPLNLFLNLLVGNKNTSWDKVHDYFKKKDEKLLIVLESCNVKFNNVFSAYLRRAVLITNKKIYITYNKLTRLIPDVISLSSQNRNIPYSIKDLAFNEKSIDIKEWRVLFYSNNVKEIQKILRNEKKNK
jgi:hypothetical protein